MDGSVEHNDSDSGDSWTILDPTPTYADEVPDFPESNDNRNIEKDEDTDGISIISESETESSLPAESSNFLGEIPFVQQGPQYLSMETAPIIDNNNILSQTMGEDDFLVDNTSKHKTYVHRRNKRLSTVLNIIVLGSVITAAGVAIGHMWGAKNDCSINTTPSVNKILSNLYKLQEENSYLRRKIKELSLLKNVHASHRISGTDTLSNKRNKCKKLFEDSLYNKNTDTPIKCVDNEDISEINMHLVENENKNEFLRDIENLKNIYKQNKSWLDYEVAKRLNHEEKTTKSLITEAKFKKNCKDSPRIKGEMLETINELLNTDMLLPEKITASNLDDLKSTNNWQERKISYADSLKSDLNKNSNMQKKKGKADDSGFKVFHKKKSVKDLDTISGHSVVSEDEIKKDDRYIEHKSKQDRKKHDRQKLHKKQKRKNKYEQWEMKGGYLKDYDDVTSSQENEYVKNFDKIFIAEGIQRENHIDQFLESNKNKKSLAGDEVISSIDPEKKSKSEYDRKTGKHKENQTNWYDKRVIHRNEARKKLEHELFDKTSPNNARWYFRRMQRREQCRAKGDNSTYRKLSKLNMNFKTKH